MMTAKVFENGRSQAIRLPKECRFNTNEVAVNKIGEIVLLMPKTDKWGSFMQAVDMFQKILWKRKEEIMQTIRSVKNYEIYVGHEYMYLCNQTKTETSIYKLAAT